MDWNDPKNHEESVWHGSFPLELGRKTYVAMFARKIDDTSAMEIHGTQVGYSSWTCRFQRKTQADSMMKIEKHTTKVDLFRVLYLIFYIDKSHSDISGSPPQLHLADHLASSCRTCLHGESVTSDEHRWVFRDLMFFGKNASITWPWQRKVVEKSRACSMTVFWICLSIPFYVFNLFGTSAP